MIHLPEVAFVGLHALDLIHHKVSQKTVPHSVFEKRSCPLTAKCPHLANIEVFLADFHSGKCKNGK